MCGSGRERPRSGRYYSGRTAGRQVNVLCCRCKVRMSGLCKVEMSGFMDGRGSNGNGAHGLEPTGTGPTRLKVLHEVKQKHLTQMEAAGRLKVADRRVRRLLLRVQERGDAAVIHGLRGQPSNRKLAAALEQQILARVRQRYADFGPTLAAEHLAQDGLVVSRETLRKWMAKAALWRPRRQRVKRVHVWRERRARFGELVMQDSSPFCWFEQRGPACQLIAILAALPRPLSPPAALPRTSTAHGARKTATGLCFSLTTRVPLSQD